MNTYRYKSNSFLRQISGLTLVLFISIFLVCGCQSSYKKADIVLLKKFDLGFSPCCLELDKSDRLIVGASKPSKIYFMDSKGNINGSLNLNSIEKIRGVEVIDKAHLAVVLDSGIYIYNEKGVEVERVIYKEDGKTPLLLNSAHYSAERLYVGDEASQCVLALSLVDIYGKTKKEELVPLTLKFEIVSTFPNVFEPKREGILKKPSSICVAPDGRVFVGDISLNLIRVFSCDGRYLYDFEKVTGIEPTSIEYDDRLKSVQTPKNTYDPARLEEHGRVHVSDSGNSKIHVFTTTGKYLFSYGEGILERPSDLAIDVSRNMIYVADAAKKAIFVFGYQE